MLENNLNLSWLSFKGVSIDDEITPPNKIKIGNTYAFLKIRLVINEAIAKHIAVWVFKIAFPKMARHAITTSI